MEVQRRSTNWQMSVGGQRMGGSPAVVGRYSSGGRQEIRRWSAGTPAVVDGKRAPKFLPFFSSSPSSSSPSCEE
ncbi:hypothetical protein MA16_Dca001697 [Dendrobium catenatum]|uniref:Uncharacterized protein n=1 Tax=Dendrobium catenatum TaxID=906689 RepID=A0A2I0WN71_9ASPA|nr:hypothetical protein MA16_Dca001697 [Dendrobium catenatum]